MCLVLSFSSSWPLPETEYAPAHPLLAVHCSPALLPPLQVRWVDAESCSGGYSLYDWHAAQRRCAPEYNISARGREGGNARLPLFMVPPGSYFAAAEAAADAAFARLKAATGRS